MAHEEDKLNDLRATLGNDAAIGVARQGKLPLPEGTLVARVAWD